MPQFTAQSLARVLTQVEREVLVEAVEIAGLEQFFTSFELETIRELGEIFNFLTNLSGFGFERFVEEATTVRSRSGDELPPGAAAVLEFLVQNIKSWVDLFLRLTGIDDALESLDQALLEFDIPGNIDVSSAIVVLIEVVELLERALAFIRGDLTPGPGETLFIVTEQAIVLTRTVLRDLRSE